MGDHPPSYLSHELIILDKNMLVKNFESDKYSSETDNSGNSILFFEFIDT